MAEEEKRESYTRLFNPILEALCKSSDKLSGAQYAILLFVVRSTYGWHKKYLPMSKSFIAEGTGLSERCVIKNINILVKKGFLICYGTDKGTRAKVYGLNKHFSKWGKGEQSDSVQSFTQSLNETNIEGERNGDFEGEQVDTQKRKKEKRNSKKEKEKKCSQNPYFLNPKTGMWEMVEEEEEGEE
jgi:phage replication O-like protein O